MRRNVGKIWPRKMLNATEKVAKEENRNNTSAAGMPYGGRTQQTFLLLTFLWPSDVTAFLENLVRKPG
jgi:hypothetical protein